MSQMKHSWDAANVGSKDESEDANHLASDSENFILHPGIYSSLGRRTASALRKESDRSNSAVATPKNVPCLEMSYDYLRSAPIRRLHQPLEENPLWKIVGLAITSVFAIAIGLPFLLLFFFLLPACLSLRWLLFLIYWGRRGSHLNQCPETVKSNDSRWLGAAWNSSVIHAVLIFEANDRLNVENFRHLLLTRVVPLYPRLTRRPISLPLSAGIGHCWLKDPKFSIDRHVFSGPLLGSEKDLQNYISELLKDGLSQDKPPWEFQIFHPFGEQQDTVAVLRVHQSVADGTALLRVLCQSLTDSQEIEIPQGSEFGSFSFCVNVFRACIIGPLNLLVWLFFSAEDCNILTHRTSWTGSLTVTWSASITLPKVIRIKQVTRSTVNCVLLSALAGALRRFFQVCGVKHPPDVKAVLPMDLRNAASSRGTNSRLGNKSSPTFISLPVAVEGCVPRLWTTRKTLGALRNSADPIILYVATMALMSVGPATFVRDLLDLLMDKASLQFSSLPGPSTEVYVGGQTLKAIYPLLPTQARMGISVTAITYADQVFVSVIAERALGPAAELILEYLEDQIEVLWNLLLHRRVPGETRTSAAFAHSGTLGASVIDEVQRINENTKSDDEKNWTSLRKEFSQLVGELKRRHSSDENYDLHVLRPRRRTLSCLVTRKQINVGLNTLLLKSDNSNSDENNKSQEITEKEKHDLIMPSTEYKVLRLLSENPGNSQMLVSEAICSKSKISRRKKNKFDMGDEFEYKDRKKDNFSSHVHLGKDKSSDSDKHWKMATGMINENSLEIILEKPNDERPNFKVTDDACLQEQTTSILKTQKTPKPYSGDFAITVTELNEDIRKNKIRKSLTEPGSCPREIFGEVQDTTCDIYGYSGPINSSAENLHCCSNLQHQMEMLQKQRNELDHKILPPVYCVNDDRFDDKDDNEEIDGGILI